MSKILDKSYALIDGILQEFDQSVDVNDLTWRADENAYSRLGVGIIDNVCGIPDYNNKQMVFYKKIAEKKKR